MGLKVKKLGRFFWSLKVNKTCCNRRCVVRSIFKKEFEWITYYSFIFKKISIEVFSLRLCTWAHLLRSKHI